MTIVPGNATTHAIASWFSGIGAVSGVGSLPFLAVAPAIEFIARWCPEVPFWPQLRRVSPREAMIPQTFGVHMRHLAALRDEHGFGLTADRAGRFFDALERTDACLDPAHAAGFYAFVERAARRFPARAPWGQVMSDRFLSVDGMLFLDAGIPSRHRRLHRAPRALAGGALLVLGS
jgi:hypothetical protein